MILLLLIITGAGPGVMWLDALSEAFWADEYALGLRFWPLLHGLLEKTGLTGAAAPDQINITVAVVVGFIALLGICVDDGVLMASNITRMVKKEKPATVSQVRSLVVKAGINAHKICSNDHRNHHHCSYPGASCIRQRKHPCKTYGHSGVRRNDP